MAEAIGAQKGERVQERLGYQSGYYPRSLITRVGKLELRVPQDRNSCNEAHIDLTAGGGIALFRPLPPGPPYVMRVLRVSPGLGRISTRSVISLQAFPRTLSIRDYARESQPSA
jgi:Transposase, Mutator family